MKLTKMFNAGFLKTCLEKTLAIILAGCLWGCSTVEQSVKDADSEKDGAPTGTVDVSRIPDAVPRDEPPSRYGNPESYEVFGNRYVVLRNNQGYVERGIASWYGTKFHGRRTSSGETYDMYAMTAAHKTLPLPTYVEVENLGNGRKVIVKVNDRGPFHDNRVLDLSYTAALKLGFASEGTALVEVRAIDPGSRDISTAVARTDQHTVAEGFFIQVGAFGNYANAQLLKTRLVGLADDLLQVKEVIVQQQKFYRVRFGPILDINKADYIIANLEKYGVQEHQFVVDL